ncbi:uncharacterized protein LOC125138857 [Tachysurus fulvidraco]|uniref:uncharacterized protein LOC125138857 n=1 Tax=Tachysurus fulvidraco TaxID=1234273 RepID=UPI001FEE7E7A|nr:uncharacterized protein LOC125138857 [Tachysurus fulvidraco]XP_047657086.1 uncharacterized protein LOC125138857 [Tachysurus fulvidraco]
MLLSPLALHLAPSDLPALLDWSQHLSSPSLTARPIFLLAMCVIIYLAIVHPVTYMATKTWFHWEWLVITFVWIYTLAVNLAIVFNMYSSTHPVFMAMLLMSLPITLFFNITTMRALTSSGPGKDGQPLNPAKKKAFRIILSIQVVLLMFYVPRTYVYIYLNIAPMDYNRFICSEGQGILMVAKLSEFAMPVIFLYSVRKLGV